jgi:uncharacterized Fe-S cluster-containing protein
VDAQRLFWIILGEDGKMDKVDKSFLFHVSEYMKNDFVSQDDFSRSIRSLYFVVKSPLVQTGNKYRYRPMQDS